MKIDVKTLGLKHFKLLPVLAATTALAGCLGGGGGGGGGAGGGLFIGSYQGAYDRVTGLVPTSNMPKTGTAAYEGAVKVDLTDNGTVIGTAVGDVEMSVDLAAPVDRNASGSITNVRGETAAGDAVNWSGALTTGYWETETGSSAGGVATVTNTVALPPPVGGTRTFTTGSMSVTMAGELTQTDTTDIDQTSTVSILLGGTFVGDQGEAVYGPAIVNVWENGAPNAAGGSGTFYMEKQ